MGVPRLVARTAMSHLPTVARHRWCAASYLFWPVQPSGSFLHRPPFEMPLNNTSASPEHPSLIAPLPSLSTNTNRSNGTG